MTSMSVSGVPSVPGFDVLFPSGKGLNSAASGTAAAGTGSATPVTGTSSGTSSSSPASGTLSSSVPGSDVLNAPLNTENVPGFDVLNPAQYFPNAQQIVNGNGSSSSGSSSNTGSSTSSNSGSASTSSNGVNPYQQTYDNIETWSDDYLLSAIENGAPALSSPTGAQSAGAFAGLSTLLSQLKPLAQLNAAAGVGTSNATPAASSSSSTDPNTTTDPAEAALGALPTFSYGGTSNGTSNSGTSSSGTNINTYA